MCDEIVYLTDLYVESRYIPDGHMVYRIVVPVLQPSSATYTLSAVVEQRAAYHHSVHIGGRRGPTAAGMLPHGVVIYSAAT